MAVDNAVTIAGINNQAQQVLTTLSQYYNSFTRSTLTMINSPVLVQPSKITQTVYDQLLTQMTAYNVAMDSILFPTVTLAGIVAPSDLSLIAKWTGDGTDWVALKSQIETFYDTATSLTETNSLTTAMSNKDIERRNRILVDLYNAANINTANKGFLYPNSMTVAMKLDAQAKYQFDSTQISRDIIKFVTEWAKSNYQHALDKGLQAQQLDVEFNQKFAQIQIEVYAAKIKGIVDIFEAQVRAAIARLEGLLKPITGLIEFAKANSVIDTEHNRSIVAKYAEDIRNSQGAFNASINASLEDVKAKTQAAAAALNGLTALASTVSNIEIKTSTV